MTRKKTPVVTINDVAAIAGVSVATVSRVINGSAKVSEDKTNAVQDAILKTGFKVSKSAQSLAKGRAESIAVVLTEPVDELFGDPTYATMFRGILDALGESNYTPILLMSSTLSEQKKAVRLLSQGVADAMIHLSPYTEDTLLAEISRTDIPLVLCGRPSLDHGIGSYSLAYADDSEGAQAAGEYLVARGAQNVLALMGPKNNPATTDRVDGYTRALRGRLGDVLYADSWTEESGHETLAAYPVPLTDYDSIVCGSDRLAAGAIQVLRERGLRVPEDVRVVGFDDHEIALQTDPALTTVQLPFREEGQAAVELAIEGALGGRPRAIALPCRLVLRGSA